MEKLAGDLVGVELCKTINSPNTHHTLCLARVGRIRVQIFGD